MMKQDDKEMIQPGDPRHPCGICSGRDHMMMHCAPCWPVPLEEAWKGDKDEELGA